MHGLCAGPTYWKKLTDQLVSAALVTTLVGTVSVTQAADPHPVIDHEGAADSLCIVANQWYNPDDMGVIDSNKFLKEAAKGRVTLLGEHHAQGDHQRWELHTLVALHAHNPNMAIGFEMFPRNAQPVLDKWIAGELSEAEFLEQSNWQRYWNFDAKYYLPLFHFARMNQIPIHALNVSKELLKKVRKEGWQNIVDADREGVSDPAPPGEGYKNLLIAIYQQHSAHKPGAKKGEQDSAADLASPGFKRFLQGQTLWDAAMAQIIFHETEKDPSLLFVGVMGSGHLVNDYGIPDQLKSLGQQEVTTMIAWHDDFGCEGIDGQFADAIIGMNMPAEATQPKPKLGVYLEENEAKVSVAKLVEGSVAEAIGLQKGDIFVQAAGKKITRMIQIIAIVQRTSHGTWLPLLMKRGDKEIEIVAKFAPLETAK
ncbi:MAG: ChaN family lipoprotein [Thiotrichaceae bacterium]|nr:ChaN family lipoprotein [Thiotrichaceae bacterium]PCI13499.1 MAG: signal protein PDZ [Thiotrichales bacterium]